MAVTNPTAVESLQPSLLVLGPGGQQVLVNQWQSREKPPQQPRQPTLQGPSHFPLKEEHPHWLHFPEKCPCVFLSVVAVLPHDMEAGSCGQFPAVT